MDKKQLEILLFEIGQLVNSARGAVYVLNNAARWETDPENKSTYADAAGELEIRTEHLHKIVSEMVLEVQS